MTDINEQAVAAMLDGVYRVEPDGRVIAIGHNWRGKGEREVSPTINSNGYLSVRLSIGGKRRHIAVHRLVAAVHLPPRPTPDHEVRHLDGDRLNPNAVNLAWGTRSENAQDRARHGTERAAENAAKTIHLRQGEKASSARLNNADAVNIRRRVSSGESAWAVAKDYPQVSYWSVNNVARGKTFGCVQ